MKAFSVVLMGLSLVGFVVLASFAQTVSPDALRQDSSAIIMVKQGTVPPRNAPYFLPIVDYNYLYQSPTPSITSTPTKTPTRTPTLTPFLPDLYAVGAGVEYFDKCPWGSPGVMSGTILNQGKGDAGEFIVILNDMDLPFFIKVLPSGMYTQVSHEFTSGPVGHLYLSVDVYNQVQESDEQNNLFYIVFTPPPPCDTSTPTP